MLVDLVKLKAWATQHLKWVKWEKQISNEEHSVSNEPIEAIWPYSGKLPGALCWRGRARHRIFHPLGKTGCCCPMWLRLPQRTRATKHNVGSAWTLGHSPILAFTALASVIVDVSSLTWGTTSALFRCLGSCIEGDHSPLRAIPPFSIS